MSRAVNVNYFKAGFYALNTRRNETVYLIHKLDIDEIGESIWIVESENEKKGVYLEYENKLTNPYYWGDQGDNY